MSVKVEGATLAGVSVCHVKGFALHTITRGIRERPVASSPRLTGWKSIATHLGRGVRTAQRWERECGLPVRRLRGAARPGRRAESVFAYVAELDAWMASAAGADAMGGTNRSARPQPAGGSSPLVAAPRPAMRVASPFPAVARRILRGVAAALALLTRA